MSTSRKLGINSEVMLEDKRYWVIGIDSYSLENFSDGVTKWQSYTMSSGNGEMAWISQNEGESFFVRWMAISRPAFFEALTAVVSPVLNLKLSGMANISFEGYRGFSTPFAETLCFEASEKRDQAYDYLASERFIEFSDGVLWAQESIYMIGRILSSHTLAFIFQ